MLAHIWFSVVAHTEAGVDVHITCNLSRQQWLYAWARVDKIHGVKLKPTLWPLLPPKSLPKPREESPQALT